MASSAHLGGLKVWDLGSATLGSPQIWDSGSLLPAPMPWLTVPRQKGDSFTLLTLPTAPIPGPQLWLLHKGPLRLISVSAMCQGDSCGISGWARGEVGTVPHVPGGLHHAPLTTGLCFSFQAERPALNVVIFPLLHEGLTDVIRDVPMVHLDEITLFKSRVAEEPPNLWW